MKNSGNAETKDITKRLDAILNVLLESALVEGKKLSVARRVAILHGVGLKPSEIGQILRKTPAYVSVEIGRIKSKSAK